MNRFRIISVLEIKRIMFEKGRRKEINILSEVMKMY